MVANGSSLSCTDLLLRSSISINMLCIIGICKFK